MSEHLVRSIDFSLAVIAVASLKRAGLSWLAAVLWFVGLGLLFLSAVKVKP